MTLHETLRKRAALAVSGIVVAALLAPAAQNWVAKPNDGFPLSYYPMFTKVRGEITTVHHAVAVTADNQRIEIRAAYAGAGGMNTNRRQMRRMVRDGRASKLAETIARNFASSSAARRHGVTHVEVVESEYSLEEFRYGQTDPVSRIVHASAALPTGEE